MPFTSLIESLGAPNPYETKFGVAKGFAEQIFARTPPAGVQVIATDESYYVDHGIGHVSRIVSKLNSLCSFLTTPLNDAESFILAVAAYYHDISMFIGRRANEDPNQIREQHHLISAEVLQNLNESQHLNINQDELDLIKRVINAHRVIPLTDLPLTHNIESYTIRTRLLGAFMRIADACDCDRSRAPKAVFDLYYDYIPDKSKEYWVLHLAVTGVAVEGSRSSIVVSINFSGDIVDKIEKYRIGNKLKKKLENELKTVEDVFNYYSIPIVRVEIKDFGAGSLVDLASLPFQEDVVTITLNSESDKIEPLAEVVRQFISATPDALPLVVEFRPTEGPLFADTGVKIDSTRLNDMRLLLQQRLANDLWSLKGEVIEKITIQGVIII